MKQYIDKAALVAEIKRKIEAHKETLKNCDSSISEIVLKCSIGAYQNLLYFLDTLEVKEVDLDGEINLWVKNLHRVPNFEELNKFAKHFFELGLHEQNLL